MSGTGRRVAHVLWRSAGGIRRHVATVASSPPCGWETAGVWGPPEVAGAFGDVRFVPMTRGGLLRPPKDVDVVHAHGITAGLAALAVRRPPVVVTVHVVVGETGRTRGSVVAALLARSIARRADAVVAVSAQAAEGFTRACVIPPAFDPLPAPERDRRAVREELGASPVDIVAMAVARLEDSKRLDLFVHAVEGSGCVGWIVGDGPERERLEALTRGSRVKLLGSRTDVADLLRAADVFALPSESESYGIAVAEAIGAGLPVVATSTGAIGELVGSGGILVPPGDADAFVESVRTLVTDDEQRARRTRAARDVVRPDARALIAELGSVYDEVSRGRKGGD